MSAEAQLDNLYVAILERGNNGIDGLLDSLFSFLSRRTDFYSRPLSETEDVLLSHLRKYHEIVQEANSKKPKKDSGESSKSTSSVPASSSNNNKPKKNEDDNKSVKKEKVDKKESRHKGCYVEEIEDIEEDLEMSKQIEEAIPTVDEEIENKIKNNVKNNNDEEKEAEEKDSDSLKGNGGKTDKYSWTQTLGTVEVVIPLSQPTRPKECSVKITAKSVSVDVKGVNLIKGDFEEVVCSEDCVWTLENCSLVLNLEKRNKMQWWGRVLKGDVSIDTSKIVPENSNLSDLDPETRVTVEKMLFDQRQKAQGLPTADQLQQAAMLERFKKSHPELDFSKANVNFS